MMFKLESNAMMDQYYQRHLGAIIFQNVLKLKMSTDVQLPMLDQIFKPIWWGYQTNINRKSMSIPILITRITKTTRNTNNNQVNHNHSVWKSPKKSHSILRAKRATLGFWMDKSSLKMPKMVHLATFWKPEACGPTVLPDRSILISQKLSEYAKIEDFYLGLLFKTI